MLLRTVNTHPINFLGKWRDDFSPFSLWSSVVTWRFCHMIKKTIICGKNGVIVWHFKNLCVLKKLKYRVLFSFIYLSTGRPKKFFLWDAKLFSFSLNSFGGIQILSDTLGRGRVLALTCHTIPSQYVKYSYLKVAIKLSLTPDFGFVSTAMHLGCFLMHWFYLEFQYLQLKSKVSINRT